jgi:hypothetical protein
MTGPWGKGISSGAGHFPLFFITPSMDSFPVKLGNRPDYLRES